MHHTVRYLSSISTVLVKLRVPRVWITTRYLGWQQVNNTRSRIPLVRQVYLKYGILEVESVYDIFNICMDT
jgi:hypothetical protein